MKVSEHRALLNYNNLIVYTIVKRMIDFTCALIGLIILLPLFVLIVLLIKLEDPKGSAFFYQTRIGKDEKPFKMYKFRSMVSNAEEKLKELLDQNEIQGAMFKMKDDPRITRVGKFIRKTSIDELPQLVNVLKGNMSLVGPRPPLPREVAEYSEYDKLRLTVTSGCTGLWQVSGRNELSFEQMVELDIQYIQKRCIIGDLKIIFKTFKLLLGAKDAF
ncbi:sugar transferase [Paenibacillus sp. CF384]|uniref:sugar transferase n=1 Tax=Paenibacillus sp. CF384 TaxID=1884382 RepID=UPI000898426D|nr:sugar transferase [Paenibacillus sp. CF384]SDX11945.1 Sugar transferase involved in LPS biosynthesis (colanic, teichoic acid) [Paenibacillus sp. CF384]